MLDNISTNRETRYGMPAADQIVVNRHYTLGYSYYLGAGNHRPEQIGCGAL